MKNCCGWKFLSVHSYHSSLFQCNQTSFCRLIISQTAFCYDWCPSFCAWSHYTCWSLLKIEITGTLARVFSVEQAHKLKSSWVGSSPLIEACTPVVTLIKRRWMPLHTAADSGSFKLFIQESASLHKETWCLMASAQPGKSGQVLDSVCTVGEETAPWQCLYSQWRDSPTFSLACPVWNLPWFLV